MSTANAETAGLMVNVSPHIRDRESTSRIMWVVFLILLPAAASGVYVFGLDALGLIAISVGSAVFFEAACQYLRKKLGAPVKITVSDGSAAVTGLLLAMVLPTTCAWYVPIVGNFFAIAIAKQAFGGLGCNIWNPALVGRAAVQVCYPAMVNTSFAAFYWKKGVDAVTSATMLANKGGAFFNFDVKTFSDMLFGFQGGAIGETSAFLLILGGLALIILDYVNWRLPIVYILTVFLVIWVLPFSLEVGGETIQKNWADKPVFAFQHLFAGGLMIGAFFMATDMVTSPLTSKGQTVFALGCGLITALIRIYGGYPEGVCYAILLMNCFVPIIDRHTRPKKFGLKGNSK